MVQNFCQCKQGLIKKLFELNITPLELIKTPVELKKNPDLLKKTLSSLSKVLKKKTRMLKKKTKVAVFISTFQKQRLLPCGPSGCGRIYERGQGL